VEVAPEVVAQNLPQASSRLVVREADLSALPLAAIAPELRVDRAQQVRRQAARPQAGALGFFADRLEDLGLVVEAAAGERQAQLREVPLRTDRADLQGGLEDVRQQGPQSEGLAEVVLVEDHRRHAAAAGGLAAGAQPPELLLALRGRQ